MLTGRKILVGISGSIAAYKMPDVIRRLRELGADVRVVMTAKAERFVSALTFEAISGNPVLCDEFTSRSYGPMGHIAVTDGLDCLLIAPATANIIGKAAGGIADDTLTTAFLAAECPVVIAPAMNDRMYRNGVVQRNIGLLRSTGVHVVDPEEGALACGASGQGRLAGAERIVNAVARVLQQRQDLAGMRVLVSAGPTREPVDAVRFISNPSSGKMGYALAEAARERGAEVVLVSGPTALPRPAGITTVPVTTAAEMRTAVLEHAHDANVIIMAAAVSDFRPVAPVAEKIKKEAASLTISLEPTDDILEELGREKGKRILVGFAAESENLRENARRKLDGKNLDIIVANDITRKDAGFGTDSNRAIVLSRDGSVQELPLMTKASLAEKILGKVSELKAKQGL